MKTETFSNSKNTPLTFEDIKQVAKYLGKKPELKIPKRKRGIFEKLMNKLGWYRQYEVYLIDTQKIIDSFNPFNKYNQHIFESKEY